MIWFPASLSRVSRYALLAALGAGALLLAGGTTWWVRGRRLEAPGSVATPRYVGDQSCRTCHRTLYDTYQRTAMARSWYLPTVDNIIEDYTENNHVYDPRRDLHYEMIARDGAFFQREYRSDGEGLVTHELVRQVSYIVGSGEHVRSYAADSGGYVTEMPVSWFADKKVWDLSPGYEKVNHRFDRPMVAWCVGCHNSYPRHVEGTLNRYESPMPAGIGCERCHGPAEWHLREQKEGWHPAGHRAGQPTIVNPADLPSDRKHDVCFQCHLQGDLQLVNPDKAEFGYRPGLRLADYRSDFLAQTADPDEFGIASHAARMVQSRCFVASGGALSCITCHDPHVPLREVPAETYRKSCLSCHRPDSGRKKGTGPICRNGPEGAAHKLDLSPFSGPCRRVPDSTAADQRNDCVSCHMARGQPADVQHAVYTDHWIRPPNRGQRSEVSTDHSPLTTQASSDLVRLRDFWDDPQDREERLGIAHVGFFFAKGHHGNLDEGIDWLAKAARQSALHRDGWRHLGMAAMAKGDPSRAAYAYERALRTNPNDPVTRMFLSVALRTQGDRDGSLAQLEQAIQLLPDQLESYLEAAQIYLERQQPQQALGLLEESLRRNPYQAAALATLGSLHCRQTGESQRGIEAYRRAIQLDPDNPAIRLSLGNAYAVRNEFEAAREQFQHALRGAPDHVPTLLAMGQLHMKRNERPQAIDRLRRVLELDAQNSHALRFLHELGASLDPHAADSEGAER